MKDRVRETSTTVGTDPFVFGGAPVGFLTFQNAEDPYVTGDQVPYIAEAVDALGALTGQWEHGVGTMLVDGSLERTTVTRSSAGVGVAVSFSAGTKRVYDGATVEAARRIAALEVAGRADASTGLLTGGQLTINTDPTKFDVGAGSGIINGTAVSWSAQLAQTVTNLATSTVTHVYVGPGGILSQSTLTPTPQSRRAAIYIGQLGHSNLTSIGAALPSPDMASETCAQMHDLMRFLGTLPETGQHQVSANGATIQIVVGAGDLHATGANQFVDDNAPNIVSLPLVTAPSIRRRTQTGAGTTSTSLDPDNYDLAGTITPLPNNKFTVQRVFRTVAGNIVVQYGQHVYDSLDDAGNAIAAEAFVLTDNVQSLAALIAFVIMCKGTTSLLDANDARILQAGTVVGAGAASPGITALTGDVVAGPGSGSQVATIQPGVVTDAMIARSGVDVLGSNSFALTFAGRRVQQRDADGAVTITGLTGLSAGAVVECVIRNTTGADIPVSFVPVISGWTGDVQPTIVPAGGEAKIVATSLGITDGEVVATWEGAQPEPLMEPIGALSSWGLPGLFPVGVAGVSGTLKNVSASRVYITPICVDGDIVLTDVSAYVESGAPTLTFAMYEITGVDGAGMPVLGAATVLGAVTVAAAGRYTVSGLNLTLRRGRQVALAFHVDAAAVIYSWLFAAPGMRFLADAPASTNTLVRRGLLSAGAMGAPTSGPWALTEYAGSQPVGVGSGGFVSHMQAKWVPA